MGRLYTKPLSTCWKRSLKKGEADGAVLLDTTIDIFKPVADVQLLLFAKYREYMYEKEVVFAPEAPMARRSISSTSWRAKSSSTRLTPATRRRTSRP